MADSRYIIELILQARDQTGTAFQSMLKNQGDLSKLQQQSIKDNERLAKVIDDLGDSIQDVDKNQEKLKKNYSDINNLTAKTAKEQEKVIARAKEYVRVTRDENSTNGEKLDALKNLADAENELATAVSVRSNRSLETGRVAAQQLRVATLEENSLRARADATRQLATQQGILLDEVEKLSKQTKLTGKDNEAAIEAFRKQFKAARGDVAEFNKAVERGSKANKKDLDNLTQSALRFADIQRSLSDLEKQKSKLGNSAADIAIAAEIDVKTERLKGELEAVKQEAQSILKLELPVELDNASVAKLRAASQTILNSTQFNVEANADVASFAKVEAEKQILAKDVKFDVEPKADLVSLRGFIGGFWTAFNDGSEKASQNVAAFDNIIRGALALGIAVFLEQLAIAAIGAASALAALVSSAISAGAALGGALAAGAAQAAPAIGVLATFASRVSGVFNAVKQANLLQQQESYKGGQAATKQASQLNQVVTAQERVQAAQEKVTEARKKAREELEKLTLSERKQTLSVEKAREELRKALSGGGSFAVEEARINLQEAQNNLSTTRNDLRSRQRSGISGSPEVKDALKNLADAKRGLEQARQSAAQAATATNATAGKLDFLLANLSDAEKRLYKTLVELQKNFQSFARNISAPLIDSVTYAAKRINELLGSSAIVNTAKQLSKSLAGAFKDVFDFALSDSVIKRILGFAREFQNNLAPLVNIAKNLLSVFLDLAEAGAPALSILIRYVDDLIQSIADFTGSFTGKRELTRFFTDGTVAVKGFVEVFKAFGNVVLALIGPGGGIKAGNVILKQLTDGLNSLADAIRNPESRIGQFTRRFFDFATQIGPILLPLLGAIADLIDKLFTPRGIESLKNFVFLVTDIVVPAFEAFLRAITFLTDGFAKLVKEIPLVQKALELIVFGALAGSVVGRIAGIFKPVTETFKFLRSFAGDLAKAYGGATKQINRTADALKSLQKVQAAGEVLDTVGNLNDAGIPNTKTPVPTGKPGPGAPLPLPLSRKGVGEKGFRNMKGIRGTATNLASKGSKLPGPVGKFFGGAALAGGVAPAVLPEAGAAATLGGGLGPIAAVAAPIIAVVAAITALLAISGKLDDVWRAIKDTISGVLAEIKGAVGELAKEITGENSAKKAFKEIYKALQEIGRELAAVLIPTFKILGAVIGAVIVGTIKRITAIVRAFKSVVAGIKQIFSGDVIGGIKTIFGAYAKFALDFLKAPFVALAGIIKRLFPNIGTFILKTFETLVNGAISKLQSFLDIYNNTLGKALKAVGINATVTIGKVNFVDENATGGGAQSSGGTSAGGGSRRVSGSGRRVTRSGQQKQSTEREKTPQTTKATNENSEKFLNSFNPETVKLADKIREKLAQYWTSLRRQARSSTEYVVDKLRDIRKDGGKSIDAFVKGARADVVSLNVAFRTRFVNISNIVRNQMVKVSNIVRNQMFNAKKAVYDGATYMKNALNEALKSVGSDATVKLSIEAPKKDNKDGAQAAAVGGWIGNRGERGRDTVPTLLGRGEAVLNWGHQKLVEPALRQTYGFGLDDMFSRTKGYHAGGPGAPGLARGGRRNGIYTASVYSDPQGYRGDQLASVPYNWAELGVNGGVGNAFGGLPYKTMIKVSYKGKSVNLSKRDIGSGGPGIGGKIRAVDIYAPAARRLGIPGLANVFVSFDGKGGSSGGTGGASVEDIVMPKIMGGTKAMREIVSKSVGKMVKAANRKLQREAPADTGGGYAAPGGKGGPAGLGQFDGFQVAKWIIPILQWARRNGWTGSITSGYRSHAYNVAQGRNYYSNHEGVEYPGGAIDVGGYGAVSEGAALAKILRGYRGPRKLVWGNIIQDYGHFSATGHAQGGYVGGPIKHYAKGGNVHGPEGQAVPVIAHAGEWILNKAQQARVAAMTGKSINTVRDALGFTGGPTSFAGGGTVEPTKAFSFPNLLVGITGKNKFFEDQLDKFGKALNTLLDNILTTRKLKQEEERIKKQIAKIKKSGGDSEKDKKKIENLETELKNINRTSAIDKLLKSVRSLTGPDGNGGALGSFYEKIKRTFDETSSTINLAAAGFERIKGKVGEQISINLKKIDPVKIANDQAEAQKNLRDSLIDVVDQYSEQVAKLKKASDRIGRTKKGQKPVSLDRLLVEQARDEKSLTELEGKKETPARKKEIDRLKKRIKGRKTDIKAKSDVESEITKLEEQKRAKEQEIIEAENARVEALKTAIDAKLTEQTKNADKTLRDSSFIKSLGETLSSMGAGVSGAVANMFGTNLGDNGQTLIDRALEQNVSASNDKVDKIKAALEATKRDYGNDPRFDDKIAELESQLQDAALAAAQAAADLSGNAITKIQAGLENATKQIDVEAGLSNTAKSFAELVGNATGVKNANDAAIGFARRRQEAINTALIDAQDAARRNPNDPRFQQLVNDLTQQAADANLAVAQAQADAISGQISAIEEAFQRGETRRGLQDRMAAIADRLVAGGGNATRMANLTGRRDDLATQRSAIQALLNDPNIQGNAKQMQELTDKLAELDVTIAENTQEINDLTLQIRQQAIERITGVSSRTGGLLGNVGTIFENVSRLFGQPNTANQISIAESLRTALGLENTNLANELGNFLSDPASSGLLGPEATSVLQQLLSAFTSGDPTSFATVLQGLAPQIASLESTLGESARGPFSSFIDSLTNNTIALTDNTANIAELNGLANQPQPFSSTSWTRFRAAIFNGLGDVLPQFDIPQMATGGYITKGGMFQLHAGEFVVKSDASNIDQGDINITVNEANQPLDVTALASRIAFEKRTRK